MFIVERENESWAGDWVTKVHIHKSWQTCSKTWENIQKIIILLQICTCHGEEIGVVGLVILICRDSPRNAILILSILTVAMHGDGAARVKKIVTAQIARILGVVRNAYNII